METDIDYAWNDIINSAPKTPSAVECQSKCAETSGCSFFSWNKINGDCWMKKSDAGRRKIVNVISGPAQCPGLYYWAQFLLITLVL